MIADGMSLIESGGEATKNYEMHCAMAYWDAERTWVSITGCCSAGCGEGEVVVNKHSGRAVCRRTQEPCPKQVLGPLLELYSMIGKTDE